MDNRIQASGFVIQPRLQFKNVKDKMLYQLFNDLANYEDSINCRRGQLITSSLSLSSETGWSRAEIRSSIKRLEDGGYIRSKPFKKNKGLLITVLNYDNFQKLEGYNKKSNQQKNQQGDQHKNQCKNQQEKTEKPCGSREERDLKSINDQQKNQQSDQLKNQQKNHTITAFINSITNINKTLKEYIDEANVKNMNLTSINDIEIFVDFALQTNALPEGTSKKILVAYFDCIRLNRQTCNISAALLTKHIEKLNKYSVNQLHYALWKHVEQYDDKREQYTLGILRNTKEHEARRGLMILKNRKGAITNGNDEQLATAVGAEQSSTRAEAERLEQIAREKGLLREIRDTEFDF
ncbi:hypothetical protein [Pseudobacillus wudalianchiensis]|uniref:Uncharacterized protein n=1 Tax=Pseudobacillus wudalianchiensis TaxID=1743143 RepID=A0A1B9ANA2_9BACI|nr:hypothetical protein [Bacillus wudalianchiensis]OCA85251.1 hypothetical protein A8F95_11295 [Bacillus wudalianchiensis]